MCIITHDDTVFMGIRTIEASVNGIGLKLLKLDGGR